MYIMFSTPLTCCSMGAATVSATTWALAPGYDADTSTVGGAMSGYCATGRLTMAMPPPSTMTMDSTEAKIGRLMKNAGNTGAASLPLAALGRAAGRPFAARGAAPSVGRAVSVAVAVGRPRPVGAGGHAVAVGRGRPGRAVDRLGPLLR